jgi:hypothetical protein
MISVIPTLRQHLEIFQQTFSNALTNESSQAQQPNHILTPLRPHQKACVARMDFLENKLKYGYPIQNQILFSGYGFLSDPDGVGKTLTALSYISQKTNQQLATITNPTALPNPLLLHPSSSSACFSLAEIKPEIVYENLIVVSHTVFRQWQDTITNSTNLHPFFIKTIKNLDDDSLLDHLQASHLTLISNTLLPAFLTNLEARNHKPIWKRVFFDDADTIKIPSSCKQVPALFTWFITSHFENILFSNQCYHSYITRQLSDDFISTLCPELQQQVRQSIANHPNTTFFRCNSHSYFQSFIKNTHPLRGNLVVRCFPDFLQESIQFPELRRLTLRCRTPARHRLVENALPAPVAEILHAGDISGALVALGVSTHTPLTLVEAVTQYKRKELENNKALLEEVLQEGISDTDEAVVKLCRDIQKQEEEIVSIQTRLANVSKESCAICFDSPESTCITPCCSRSFCTSCILEWMSRVASCPLCRTSFHPNELLHLGNECRIIEREPREEALLKKHEQFVKLFNETPNGKFIVYSKYDNPFISIPSRYFRNMNMTFLSGNKDQIANILSDFERGYIKVLFVNPRTSIAGINIPSATHILFWHKIVEEDEKNIISRAYCLGRTQPLHCITLLNERE